MIMEERTKIWLIFEVTMPVKLSRAWCPERVEVLPTFFFSDPGSCPRFQGLISVRRN